MAGLINSVLPPTRDAPGWGFLAEAPSRSAQRRKWSHLKKKKSLFCVQWHTAEVVTVTFLWGRRSRGHLHALTWPSVLTSSILNSLYSHRCDVRWCCGWWADEIWFYQLKQDPIVADTTFNRFIFGRYGLFGEKWKLSFVLFMIHKQASLSHCIAPPMVPPCPLPCDWPADYCWCWLVRKMTSSCHAAMIFQLH